MKKTLLALVACSALSLGGCVTITSEVDGEEAIGFEDGAPAQDMHPLYRAVTVGDVEGFSGTSIFIWTGDVSPDMDNEGVRFALERTLKNAAMLSSEHEPGRYVLDAEFVSNNEEGVWGGGFTQNRKTQIRYSLTDRSDRLLYNQVVASEGGDSTALHLPFYFNEKRTAVKSYQNNFSALIEELKQVKPSEQAESRVSAL